MERSNYQEFMDCLDAFDVAVRAATSGVVLYEKMQECDALGIPYEDIDFEKLAWEIEKRLAFQSGELYAFALYEWTNLYFSKRTDKSDAAAEEKDCGFSIQPNNST